MPHATLLVTRCPRSVIFVSRSCRRPSFPTPTRHTGYSTNITAHGPDRAGTLKAHPKTSHYELPGREESSDAHGHLETAWPGTWRSAAAVMLLLPCCCLATLVGGSSSVSTRACSCQPGERGGSHPGRCNGLPIPVCRHILFFVFLFLFSQATETARVDRGTPSNSSSRSCDASEGKSCGQLFFMYMRAT